MSCALDVRTVVMLFIRLHEQETAWPDVSSWKWSSFFFALVAKLILACINYLLSLPPSSLPPSIVCCCSDTSLCRNSGEIRAGEKLCIVSWAGFAHAWLYTEVATFIS